MSDYNFWGPSRKAVRKGTCPVCGKRGQRQTTIEHTVNPFNRDETGAVKTWDQVREDVIAEAIEWGAQSFVHERCEQEDQR